MSVLKRIKDIFNVKFLLVIILFLITFGAPTEIHANWVGQGFGRANEDCWTGDAVAEECAVNDAWSDTAMTIVCHIIAIPGDEYCGSGESEEGSYLHYLQKRSALNNINGVMLAMYTNPPANLRLWLADTGQSLGFFPKKVYAQGNQGIGFGGLSALLPFWKVSRNIATLILAIFIIIIGFMIMFRKKIDPKTVISVQNALPRIVVTLILITFSYAIVGFVIDLMYVLILLVVYIIGTGANSIGLNFDVVALQSAYLEDGLSHVFLSLWSGGWEALPDIINFIIGAESAAPLAEGAVKASVGAGAVVAALGFGPTSWLLAGLVGIVGVIFLLLFAIVLLFAFIRIFFMLLTSYINIIVSLILAPFQLVFGALPGTNAFGTWIMNLIANVLVFPATVGLLMFGAVLAALDTVGVWYPPLLIDAGDNAVGVSGIIALGVLLSIPTIVNGMKDGLKAKSAMPIGAGIGGAISSPAATAMQAASTMFYIKQLTGGSVIDRFVKKPKSGGE